MSIQAVGWVLEHSDTRMADRLVLLAIANHAGTSPVDGAWEAWPGVDLIAAEARLAPRIVQVALARLEADGVLERVVNGAPDDRIRGGYRPNLYRIVTTPRGEAPVHPSAPDPGDDDPPGGVHASDTPDVPRGVAAERAGVSSDDIEGCRPTTPKPSVEPSMNQTPPSPEPRGLAPDADTAGGSTTHQQPGLTGDERRARIHQATTILASRLADRTASVGNRHAWIGSVAERLAGEHAAAGLRHLVDQPELSPAELADLLEHPPDTTLEDQRARQHQAEEATRRRIRDTAAQPGNRARSAHEARRLRDQLRNPRTA